MSEDRPQVGSVQNHRVTWEGCSVLLDVNDGDRLVFARLNQGSTLKFGNKNYSLRPLIGCPFGSLFQVDNGAEGSVLSRVTVRSPEGNGSSEPQDECRDNRGIVDNNTAQSLTGEDIEALRREGATGEKIIEALIANSATFEKKTAFSQEKYRLKKQKKYAPKLLVRRPVTRSICEAYFKKYPNRIGFLRLDALSLLLAMGNVAANSDILVVDMVGGLLTGAVAERLGGSGYEEKPSFHSLSETVGKDEIPHSSETEMVDTTCESSASPVIKACKSPKAGEKASREMIHTWRENGFSSLIVAAPELDICSAVKDLLPLLAYSASFAIYHQYLQPLATCMHYLQTEKMAIGMEISEPWLREYQVLPSRTHPCMQMSAFGGYILSGTRISNPSTSAPMQ
ncbi:hypothetical protein CRG98_002202 [Punica granatum]|uniref:tRNA (adenine(58)-N(1))-methyltransferase non-catalytic subunit TRM6 n=1 Tax=Punica granatum TaxID=22663 RepID=A0A2I0L9R2_PUNGR|nr:hypothetical protein CRG98_002202 [Punica granatum]